ncbi:VWA domain-containing protein [uncultured Paraglaciecola sp.]|uniref:vWA domain-containing protein n=1 Tax=uncultured Paraglaciecola sp. TaxID=1765024 RepID=UPI0030DD031E|tara:strand:- start:275336 stop:277162 length:1827 start_codon:yes stop_codon:yes gene_type:complete
MKNVAKSNHGVYALPKILISGTLLVFLGACSSGTTDNKAEEKQAKLEKPVKVTIVENQPKKISSMGQVMADQEVMANNAIHYRPQQQFRMTEPNKQNTENYQHYNENGVQSVFQHPVSTFSIDVDTGSYTNVRRMITQGVLPPADAIRVEEFINYFDYDYPKPNSANPDLPFSINTAITTSPWAQDRHIMRIGLKGFSPDIKKITGRNLVFLLDVSGSMNQTNKLPLLTRSLEMLTAQLDPQDSVSIVVYAGASGVVLQPTSGNEKAKINQALSLLKAGGATNGQAGIELAYNMAEQAFIKEGVNRVILATDGDFNLGLTSHERLIELIKQKRQKGIALTTLGFGQGNYNDHLMEQLADAGNGNYAYIDTIHEARKVLVDEMNATLLTIAKDVKIQVEFNPDVVAEYRLIGYENRALNREDFNNDKVDAGEIGAGHTVTAMYELTLNQSNNHYLDPLRYQQSKSDSIPKLQNNPFSDELALVKLRYKAVDREESQLITKTVLTNQISDFKKQSDDFRFASSVVGFAHLLKQSHYWQDLSYQQIIDMALEAKGKDEFGYRAEFIQLVRSSASLHLNLVKGAKDKSQSVELNLQAFTRNIEPKAALLIEH